MRPIKGQSTIELMLIVILVVLAIVVGGPYVLRSVNAHFKLWDDAAQDSLNDHLVEGRNEQINITLPTCSSCVDTKLDCGLKQYNCPPTQRAVITKCYPAGCGIGNDNDGDFKGCVADDLCCSIPVRTPTCWRPTTALTNPTPADKVPSGFHLPCNLGDRVFAFNCGTSSGQQVCQQDTVGATVDGDRDCTPICNTAQLKDNAGNTSATLCPNSDIGLTDDTNVTFTTSCDGTTKCQATCGTGYDLVNNACVPNATCSDNAKNGDETGVDCGGSVCPACAPTCSPVVSMPPASVPGMVASTGLYPSGTLPSNTAFYATDATASKVCEFAGHNAWSSTGAPLFTYNARHKFSSPSDNYVVSWEPYPTASSPYAWAIWGAEKRNAILDWVTCTGECK